jgi:Zinc carboxypeptidase
MKKLLIIIFCILSVCSKAQSNRQDSKVTDKFFSDPNIEINTPAFQKKKGFTSYPEMMTFVNTQLSKHADVMTLSFIGKSQKGKEIPLILLNKKVKGSEQKIKVWIQASLHGDEPGSTEGVLYLLDKILNDSNYSYLLNKLEIAIIPMANIDGAEMLERTAANGLDLNRDQTKLMAPESNILKKAFSDFTADVAIDFHEYQPYRKDYIQFSTYGVVPGFDAMFMYSGNLNVPKSLREYTKSRFVNNAAKLLDENQLRHHDYFTTDKVLGAVRINQGSSSSRSSATSYALANTISSLIEIRGVGIGRTSLKRRVQSIFLIAFSYMKTAYDNADEVKAEISKAVANPNPEVVVKSSNQEEKQKLAMIDLDTYKEIEIDVNLADAWKLKAVITRKRPSAYILLPDQVVLIEKLKMLGLNVTELKKETELEVENYTISEYQKDSEEDEGVFRQDVLAKTQKITRTFPAGSFVVSLSQRKSNLAVEVLEPEAPNSFVSFSILKTDLNKELPVFRYLGNSNL